MKNFTRTFYVLLTILLLPFSSYALSNGDRITVASSTGVNVRNAAGGTKYANGQPYGATGTIISNSQVAQVGGTGTSYTWWDIDFDSGQDGWVASDGDAIVKITPALSITTTAFNPSTATVGTGYSAQQAVTATGGQTPYTWSATGLPNGMGINSSSGAIFGTPTGSGAFNVTVSVADSSSPQKSASKTLTLTVNNSVSTAILTLYVHIGSSSGPILSGAVVTGNDAAGQTFNQTTGSSGYVTITGTPGTWQFSVSANGYAVNSWSQSITSTGQKDAFLTATTAAPAISTSSLSAGTQNTAYTQTLSATGGTTPYTWSLYSGSLPSGLNLNSSGTISGTPTVATTASFTVQVTGGNGLSSTKALSLTINTASTSQPLGIDVSDNQGSGVSWPAVAAADRSFAFVKASEGNSYEDTIFQQGQRMPLAAANLNNNVGVYHYADPEEYIDRSSNPSLPFTDPTNPASVNADAIAEADNFFSVAGAYLKTPYLQPALDLEDDFEVINGQYVRYKGGFNTTGSSLSGAPPWTWSQIASWVNAWTAELQAKEQQAGVAGIKPILYMTRSWAAGLAPYLASNNNYELWVAAYTVSPDPVTPENYPVTGPPYTWTPSIWPWVVEQYNTQGSGSPPGDWDALNPALSGLDALRITGVTTDTTPPTISVFSVSPSSVASGQGFTINYAVSDSGGTGLNRVVLRRTSGDGSATDPGWQDIQTNTASGNGLVSGSFTDTPSNPGTYWYGLAVFDNASPTQNHTDERAAGLGPQQVSVTAADTQGPSLSVSSPANNSTVTSAILTISGNASDSGLGNNGVSVTVNGANATGGSATGNNSVNWSATVTLSTGSNTITIVAKDSLGNSTSQSVTVIYNPPDTINPSISITSPVSGSTYSTSSSSVSIAGSASDNVGVTQVTWSNDRGGSGIASGTTSWSVSGISLQSGQNVITVTARDAAGNTGIATLTVTYNPLPPAPVITSSASASGAQGQSFSYQIAATNNPTGYGASNLPPGLNVNTTTGVISGTPTTSGTFNVGLSASNSGGTGTAALTLSVFPPAVVKPTITSSLTAAGTQGQLFSYQITATNSPTGFYATNLPNGLSTNTSTGVVSGTPTVSGTFNATISASNAGGTDTEHLTLVLSPQSSAPVITSALMATATQGQTFNYQIAATNTPTSYGASGLPTGLNVNTSTGVISGTPSVSGTFAATISASNLSGTGQNTLQIAVAPIGSSRAVTLKTTGGTPGATVDVSIELTAQGDENAIGFSVNFNTSQLSYVSAKLGSDASGATLTLNTANASSGQLGAELGLPIGQAFSTGTRQIVIVTFTVANTLTNGTTAALTFGNTPIGEEVSSVNASIDSANFVDGGVSVIAGYEGDVAPRPNGNGQVTVSDWVQVGRFAAGLDTPSASELMRADCAPRSSLGNGAISITDWVQAGRYAAGLDPLTPTGGPNSPTSTSSFLKTKSMVTSLDTTGTASSALQITNTNCIAGASVSVPVQIVASGSENAVGFSVNFDPALLTSGTVELSAGASGAILNVNANQAANGQLGIALAMPTGQTFTSGTLELVRISFTAVSGTSGSASLSFGDAPIAREIADASANSLYGTYAGGSVAIVTGSAQLTVKAATPPDGGIGGTTSGAGTFPIGSQQQINATPNLGYWFTGWSGSVSGTGNPLFVTMDADKNITANFALIQTDSDHDGIWDGWELKWFGNLTTAGIGTDSNDDGYTDVEAFKRGFDPTAIQPKPYQPDGAIGFSASSKNGEGIYDEDATGQALDTTLARGHTKSCIISVQNDGTKIDSISVQGDKKRSGFSVHYFSGTTDVTQKVTHGRFTFRDMPPGTQRFLRAAVTVGSKAPHGESYTPKIMFTSAGEPEAKDSVQYEVTVK
jgi:GH25 family lysozyme M1 (1,4-beta-N-acetylmuramidase)